FWAACHGGRKRTAQRLLTAGADVNWEWYDGQTPLNAARRIHKRHIVTWLLGMGARENEWMGLARLMRATTTGERDGATTSKEERHQGRALRGPEARPFGFGPARNAASDGHRGDRRSHRLPYQCVPRHRHRRARPAALGCHMPSVQQLACGLLPH